MWSRQRKNPPSPQAASPAPTQSSGTEFGWRAHEAIQGWTASVDIKASIVLIVEVAVAGAAAPSLITRDGELHNATGLRLAVSILALVLLALSVGFALWVVFPRMQRRRAAKLAATSLIYFGHLNRREPAEIANALANLTPEEERLQLARQLKITSQVAWRKHGWLQISLVIFAVGALTLCTAFVAWHDPSPPTQSPPPAINHS